MNPVVRAVACAATKPASRSVKRAHGRPRKVTSNPLAAARNTLGAVRLEQGRLDDARTHFQTALERDPRYGVPFGNLAVLAAMKGDAAGAEEARAKAAALGFKPKLLAQVIAHKLAQAPTR